jgi:hypothetical protein
MANKSELVLWTSVTLPCFYLSSTTLRIFRILTTHPVASNDDENIGQSIHVSKTAEMGLKTTNVVCKTFAKAKILFEIFSSVFFAELISDN